MLRRILRKLKPHVRWRQAIIVFSLSLSLIAASVILAQRTAVRPTSRPANNQPEEAAVSPASLLPSSPSKEYVYIGGKLVATEEPAP